MPYDVDNTFGIDWFNVDWAKRDPYGWSPAQQARPLYTRILEVPAYRKEFTRLFRDFLIFISTDEYLVNNARTIRDLIAPHVVSDPLHSADYGWSYNDFLTSYNARLNTGHVKYGLIPYIKTRTDEAERQLDLRSGVWEKPVTQVVRAYPNPASTILSIENATGYTDYRLISSLGQVLKRGRLENTMEKISLEGMPEGICVLMLDGPDKEPFVHKILISGIH